MRLFTNVFQMFREVERDLWEMSIRVHPETMQDMDVRDNPDYDTIELQGYSFSIVNAGPLLPSADLRMNETINYQCKDLGPEAGPQEAIAMCRYIKAEMAARVSPFITNPGPAWKHREQLWAPFIHDGKFAYTYSERMNPQLPVILQLLRQNPNTRQAIINIHSNICPSRLDSPLPAVVPSDDLHNLGGGGRVPCSMYYQLMIRNKRLHLIYTMRSCDFLTHFLVDVCCAIHLLNWFATELEVAVGNFTYFAGSLHAYQKDMAKRGIF